METDKSGSYENGHVGREPAGESTNSQENDCDLIGTPPTHQITETAIQRGECASG